MTKATLPVIKAKELQNFLTKEGEIKIKYLKGHPRGYRFNASSGVLNLNGEIPVTKPGKPFTLIPIAYRIFKDRLFNLSRREWLEVFFIDSIGAISAILFHGYSVEAFLQMTQELFYEDLSITEIEITITPQPKESKSKEGGKYYIAEFEYKEAEPEYIKTAKSLIQGQEIYRDATIKATNDMVVWENYPIEIVEKEKANGEETEEEKTKDGK